MKKELLKNAYFHLHEVYGKIRNDPCSWCDEIDCGGNYIYSLLKKKHQVDVIDRKACKIQRKKEAKELAEILRQKEFDQFRKNECKICKKKFEPEETMFCNWTTPSTNRMHEWHMTHECSKCFKKQKKKDRPEGFHAFKDYL